LKPLHKHISNYCHDKKEYFDTKLSIFPVNKFDKNQSKQHSFKDLFSNWWWKFL